MGNASSADAGEIFLTITKNTSKNAVKYLELYKTSLKTETPSGGSYGGAFAPSKPNYQTLPHTSFSNEGDMSYRLKIPPVFKDTGLISDRALDTIGRVEAFIAENVLPK